MAKERASIKGSEVVSVRVGQVWTVVKIRIPTKPLVSWGEKMEPKRHKGASNAAKKAVKTKAEKAALAAAAVAGN
jgi:hypothetical protein